MPRSKAVDHVAMRTDANFGFAVPEAVEGVDSKILNPRETWADTRAYDAMARKLVGMFVKNFAKFEAKVGADVKAASPTAQIAAEYPRLRIRGHGLKKSWCPFL